MKRVRYTLSIGFVGAEHRDVFDWPDEATDEEINEDYQQWCQNYMDGGWYVLEDAGDES